MSNKNLVALMIGIGMIIWLMSGTLSADKTVASTDANAQAKEAAFKVRAIRSVAIEQVTSLEVSGQTEANRMVTVRAEVPGRIDKMAAVKFR